MLGNYTGAIEYYDKALAIDACSSNALTEKGLALYHLGNYTGAMSYHDKAVAALLQHLLGESRNKGLLHAYRLLHANPYVGAISQNGTCSCSVRNETGLHCVPCSGLPEGGGEGDEGGSDNCGDNGRG